jgi:hypothetical protein
MLRTITGYDAKTMQSCDPASTLIVIERSHWIFRPVDHLKQ